MNQPNYISEEGLRNLKSELDHLLNVERPSISKQIAEAREKGDLSENYEYVAAKEAQNMLEIKIIKLRTILENSRLMDKSRMNNNKIQLFSKVKIRNLDNNSINEYTIVSENESNLKSGKISLNSPIAQGLLGKKVNDTVEIQAPSGKFKFQILKISI